jgi:hypothetical protein
MAAMLSYLRNQRTSFHYPDVKVFYFLQGKVYLSLDLDDTIKPPDLWGDGWNALSLSGLIFLK